MVSAKQLKANQKNAQLGGVKSPKGKAISKYNAQKHGILRISVTDYEKEFYSQILEDLATQYEPQGIIEQILIERIAINYLKLFRVQKAETEYIKSILHPRVTSSDMSFAIQSLANDEVVNEGYTPKIGDDIVEKLSNIYSRYETTIENRLFRALHELERAQRLRKGEKIFQPVAVDVNKMGSFGESQ